MAVNASAVFGGRGNGVVNGYPIAGGSGTTVAPPLEGGGYLAVDATTVYVGREYSKIFTAPAAGGGTVTELWGSLVTKTPFAADATHLFALSPGTGQVNAVKRAKSGGTVAQLGQVPSAAANGKYMVAVDATHMWVAVWKPSPRS